MSFDSELPQDPSTACQPTGRPPLSFEATRVLGCLIEKELTTPDYYPLTLNALISACNQTTNRDPIVSFNEREVERALEQLRSRRLVFQVSLASARTQKFRHDVPEQFPHLGQAGIALLAVLMLRGQQTAGELRQRTERLHAFIDLGSVEAAMISLLHYPGEPLAVQFPPGGGRKAVSYAHLLNGPVAAASPGVAPVITSPISLLTEEESAWREKIETEVTALRAEVERLRNLFEG